MSERMMRILSLFLLVLTLAGTCGAAVPGAADADLVLGAAAGSIQPLRGINIGPLGNLSNLNLTSAYLDRGVNLIRTHDFYGPMDMATIYPDRTKSPSLSSSFNFAGIVGSEFRSSDDVFRAIVDGGFEPFLRLGDSFNDATPPTASQRSNWEQAGLQVVRHYREGAMNGTTSNLRYVEIWNEPDNLTFWPSPFTAADYHTPETATILRAAIPSLRIGVPAVTPAGCKSANGQAWVRAFLDAVRAANAPLDFFSWHLYSNTPEDYSSCAAFDRTELDTRGFTSTVQIVSEWNTATSGLSNAEIINVRAMARGAAINTAGWINMQTAGVSQEMFYRGPEPTTDDGAFYGMFYGSGTPKKVGYAAQLWNTISQYPTRLSMSGGASNFYALAASSTTAGTAVLVANTSATARTWSLASVAGSSITVKTVSDAADGVVATTQTSDTFSIPAYGVQLIIVGAVPTSTQTFTATASASGSSSSLTLDLSMTVAAGGSSIYVAYGRSQADMLARGLYRLVYTL